MEPSQDVEDSLWDKAEISGESAQRKLWATYPETPSRLVEVWGERMVIMADEGLSPIISRHPLPQTFKLLFIVWWNFPQ